MILYVLGQFTSVWAFRIDPMQHLPIHGSLSVAGAQTIKGGRNPDKYKAGLQLETNFWIHMLIKRTAFSARLYCVAASKDLYGHSLTLHQVLNIALCMLPL